MYRQISTDNSSCARQYLRTVAAAEIEHSSIRRVEEVFTSKWTQNGSFRRCPSSPVRWLVYGDESNINCTRGFRTTQAHVVVRFTLCRRRRRDIDWRHSTMLQAVNNGWAWCWEIEYSRECDMVTGVSFRSRSSVCFLVGYVGFLCRPLSETHRQWQRFDSS